MPGDGQVLWRAFCATADQASFEALYENYRSLVWTLCRRILFDEDDVRDAFQSTWARLFAFAREEGPRAAAEPVGALIYKLSIREADALKGRRIRRRRREIVMDELPNIASGAIPADEVAAAAERRTRLETIVAMLPDKYRLPIQLHYLHGMTQLQIAEIMEIPRATVAARLSRGLRRLTPLAERAGLGDVATLIGAAAVGGALFTPPKALAGAVVYVQIQSMLAAGTTTAALASGVTATLSKTILGVTIVNAKIAVVSGLLLIAAITAVGVHYKNRGEQDLAGAVTNVQAATDATKPALRPAIVVAPPVSAENAKNKTATTAMPAATPTPAATPMGPMRDIRVAVIWGDTQAAATETTVSMQNGNEPNSTFPCAGRTNASGLLTLKIPEAWENVRSRASNPDSLNMYQAIVPATAQQPIIIKLTRAGRIYGNVKFTDGRPVAGAEIGCQGIGAFRVTRSAADGSFEVCSIPAGGATLVATYQNLRSDIKETGGRSATAIVGERVGPVALVLEPGLSVSGVVTASKTGKPVPGATVIAPNNMRPGNIKATTDLAGRFNVVGLTEARQTIRVKADNYAVQARMVMPSAGAESRCDFALEPGGEIEVTVVDEKDKPVEGAQVSAYANSISYSEDALKTDSSGKATVRNLAVDQRLSMSASKTGVGTDDKSIMFPPGELKTTARLTLKQENKDKGFLAGTVTDENGKPLAGINIFSGYFGNPANFTATTKTDGEGKYELESPDRSSWQLTAYGDGWGTEMKQSVMAGTKENPTRTDFTMKPAHWLAGLVVDEKDKPLEGVQVSLRQADNGGQLPNSSLTTDASGRFRAENLPDARIGLSLSGKNVPDQSETASVDTETKIVMKSYGSIRGVVLDKATQKPVEAFAIKVAGNSIDYNLRSTGQAFSSPDGKFEIKLLKKDDPYDLTVESKGYSTHTESKVVATAADGTDQVTVLMTKGSAIRGVLIDANSNTPIAGALLAYGSTENQYFSWRYISDPNYGGNIQIVARAMTGVDGRFELNVDNDKLTLWILPREHKRMILADADRQKFRRDKEYVIPIAPGAQLTGKVFMDGKIQPRTDINLNQLQSNQVYQNVEYGQVTTDDQGVYQAGGLESGRYSLSGPQRRMGNMGYYVYQRIIELKEGERKEVNLGDNLGSSLLAGAVLNDGAPVPFAQISLRPAFTSDYESISGNSDGNGVYAIDGLKPGKYNAYVNKMNDSGPTYLRIEEVVEVGAGTTNHDFEKGGHKVTARLAFDEKTPPALRSSLRTAQIVSTNIQQTVNGPSEQKIDNQAQCEIKAGALVFSGRFKGEYQMMLIGGGSDGGRGSAITLSQKFPLDNIEADQDLGDIQVPATGRIKVSIRMSDPSVKLQQIMAIVMPTGGQANVYNQLSLDPNKLEQTVGPVAVGNSDLQIIGTGFRCEPPRASVAVSADADAGPVSFTITPSADIMIYAMGGKGTPQSPAMGAKVTLSGNGIQRSLQSSSAKFDQQALLAAYASNKDMAVGPIFAFRDLPNGQYTVTIEAGGCKPFTQQVQAVRGRMIQMQAQLQPAQ